MRVERILPLFLLTLLLLVSGLNAVFPTLPEEYGFHISIKRWDLQDHIVIYSNKQYHSISTQVVAKSLWIGNTLYVGVEGVRDCYICLMAVGPASKWISDFEDVVEGVYPVILVWDGGGVECYRVTKGEGLMVTRTEANFIQVFLANMLVLTPWLNLMMCIGLCLIYQFRSRIIIVGKRTKDRLEKVVVVTSLAVIAYGLLDFLHIIAAASLGESQAWPSHRGFLWILYGLIINAALIYMGRVFYRNLQEKSQRNQRR